MEPWWWIVYALAVARWTGLVTIDYLTRPIRDAILRRLTPDKPSHERFAYWLECPWCAGMFWAALAIPVAYAWGWHWSTQIVGLILATSQIAGMLATTGRDN